MKLAGRSPGMRLAPLLLTLAVAACSGSRPTSKPATAAAAAPATATAAATASATATATATAPEPAPEPDPVDALVASLSPQSGEAALLIGLHLEDIEGYYPMFSSEGKPRTNVEPGYRTVLVHTKDGSVTVVGELPFLVVPQEKGFRFMGESSVSIHEPEDPGDTNGIGVPRPHDYDATDVWSTDDIKKVDAVAKKTTAALRKKKEWGKEDTEQLVFVTPRASCSSITWTEWTGGAAWFMGNTYFSFFTISGPEIDDKLVSHVDDATLRSFAKRAFADDKGNGPDIDIDQPYDDWGRTIHWRDDTHICLSRGHGKVHLLGTVVRSGNAWRSFTVDLPIAPAPLDLAPANAFTADLAAVVKAFGNVDDFFVSPSRDVLLLVKKEELVVYDALGKKEGPKSAWKGRIVMSEWLQGERVAEVRKIFGK